MKLEQEQSQLQSRIIAQSVRLSIGTLIGVPDCGVCAIELRLGADIDGNIRWLYRADFTDGAWLEHGCGGNVEFESMKRVLREEVPLHVAVWYESDDAYQWMDC
jgi:hypothetical protein